MHRFFVQPQNIKEGGKVIFPPAEAKHLAKVLRLPIGSRIRVVDGLGKEYSVRLTCLSPAVEGVIMEEIKDSTEPWCEITLAQGLPKGEKMDFIVQKCVELGIMRIIPLEMEYSVTKLNAAKKVERQKRWQRIAAEAVKQSGRQVVPIVDLTQPFYDIIKTAEQYDLAIFPYEKAKNGGVKELIRFNPSLKKILLCVGPEGGFSQSEVNLALEHGVKPITLGPRILRTETAAVVATALLLYEAGDLGG